MSANKSKEVAISCSLGPISMVNHVISSAREINQDPRENICKSYISIKAVYLGYMQNSQKYITINCTTPLKMGKTFEQISQKKIYHISQITENYAQYNNTRERQRKSTM